MRAQPASARTTVRRRAGRGQYERERIERIIDAGLVGNVAFAVEGQPYAIPMLYVRVREELFLHGSPLSRLLGTAAEGVRLCFTVTVLDGLVLARSAFHHSLNYRSVVVLGRARAVHEREEKLEAMEALVERVAPGRPGQIRGSDEQELSATEVVALPLSEASAKGRTGPPVDAPEDYRLPVWAGVIPLRLVAGEPQPDPAPACPFPTTLATSCAPMLDSRLHRLLAHARSTELREIAAGTGRERPPLPLRRLSPDAVVTLRFGFPDDAEAVARLAQLDGAEPPTPPILLGEVEGELRAVLSLADGAVIADPFHPTAALVSLLRARAAQLRGGRARPRRERLLGSRRLRARLGLPASR